MLIGEILKDKYGLKDKDIEDALELQKKLGGYIGQIFIQTGLIAEKHLMQGLSEQLGLAVLDDDLPETDADAIILSLNGRLDIPFLIKNNFVPVRVDSKAAVLTLATNDPLNTSLPDYIMKQTDYAVEIVLSTEQTLNELSRLYYDDKGRDLISLSMDDSPERLKEMAFEAPIIKFLNNLLSRAVEQRASDIHIEPLNGAYKIRFRVDGILHNMEVLDESFYLAVISRIKLLSGLDIADKRLPQDGKFSTRVTSMIIDVRVSTIPTVKGEGVVMRLLYREHLTFDISRLGLEADHEQELKRIIMRPNGIILVTGPTGSGKTTTLYSVLVGLNKEERKIVTVEDPVEYQLEGINQIQVKSDIGLSFPASLRSILRHDPDIIMVGEIRDAETAAISIQSALTGHLVLSTLHTNDAPSSLYRLVEMGVESYLINAAVIGVIAQRIIRRNCPDCVKPVELSEDVMKEYRIRELQETCRDIIGDGARFMRAEGCTACAGTGYLGRIAIFEMMPYTDDVKEIFLKHMTLESLKAFLKKEYAYRTLREDGIIKVIKGHSTIEEVLRVT